MAQIGCVVTISDRHFKHPTVFSLNLDPQVKLLWPRCVHCSHNHVLNACVSSPVSCWNNPQRNSIKRRRSSRWLSKLGLHPPAGDYILAEGSSHPSCFYAGQRLPFTGCRQTTPSEGGIPCQSPPLATNCWHLVSVGRLFQKDTYVGSGKTGVTAFT